MIGIRRSIAATTILASESVVRMGLVAIVSFIVARHLGPAEFGLLNFASAVLAVFYSLAWLGLDTLIIRELSRGAEHKYLLNMSLRLILLSGTVSAVLMVVLVGAVKGWQDRTFALAAVVSLSLPLSALMIFDFWFKSNVMPGPPALARISSAVVSSAAKLLCIGWGLGVLALAWTIALESLLMSAAIYLAYRLKSRGWVSPVGVTATVAQPPPVQIVREALPFLVTALASAAFMKIDVITLGVFSTDEQTGIFSLSQKLAEVIYIVPVLLLEVLFPQLVRIQRAGSQSSEAADQLFFDASVAISLVLLFTVVPLIAWLIPWLFGSAYRSSAGIFLLHAWSCLGIVMIHGRFKWLASQNAQAMGSWLAIMTLVVCAGLCLALIPRFGAQGAAVASVAGCFLSGCLLTWCFPVLRPVARMQLRSLWPWGRLYRHFRLLKAAP